MKRESEAKAGGMRANAALTHRGAESGYSCIGAWGWNFNAQVRTGNVAGPKQGKGLEPT